MMRARRNRTAVDPISTMAMTSCFARESSCRRPIRSSYKSVTTPSSLIFPESGPARHPGCVGDDGDVGPRIEIDLFRIAAAYIEVVEIDEAADLADGPPHALLPLAVAHTLARCVANVLVI